MSRFTGGRKHSSAYSTSRRGYTIGCDEVGTGALAGPALVCCVCVPTGWVGPRNLRDSKKIKRARERNRLSLDMVCDPEFKKETYLITVPEMDRQTVPCLVSKAMFALIRHMAAFLAFQSLRLDRIITDGNMKFEQKVQGVSIESIPKADDLFPAVSAASVVGKVHRDHLMSTLYHERYPVYRFDMHKGYGTQFHNKIIAQFGALDGVHRTKNGVRWGT